LLLALALSLVACGADDDGGDDKSAQGPGKQEDIGAIEQLMLAYGAAEGGDVCSYYAENQIEATGGAAGCKSSNADTASALFKVENVAVNGDRATAVVSVEGQEDELSTYELSREAGGWKISGFPSDDGPGGGGSDEEEPAPVDSGGSDRAEVEQLLTDFGQASGDEVCGFFSEDLIQERGGLQACQQFFADKPPLDSEIVDLSLFIPGPHQDALPSATAVIRSGVSGNNLKIGLTNSNIPDDPYGGWEISSQSD
jgi:hypothetical protein